MEFTARLKQIRKKTNYTQDNVCALLGVSRNCYASWEQGRTQPNIESIKKLCLLFNVSADYLLGLED